MKQNQATTVTGVNTNVAYRVRSFAGLIAQLEAGEEPAAPPAEAETAAPRIIVVTSGKPGSDKYEVNGAVVLTADAPDMDTLKRMFSKHLADIDLPNTYFSRPSRIASDFVTWLVEQGFTQDADAVECNVTASFEHHGYGHGTNLATRATWFDLLPLPRSVKKEK